MLNPFPELLNYSLLAPLILRVLLGLIFVDLGVLKFGAEKKRWEETFSALRVRPADFFTTLYGLVQIVGGLSLIVGFYTQISALVFVILTGAELAVEWRAKEILKRDLTFYLFLFVISLSLLLSGAGAFAFDLPL